MGAGQSLGRSLDRLVGLCVSGVVTIAVAAVTLKIVAYHTRDCDINIDIGEDGASFKRRRKGGKVPGGEGYDAGASEHVSWKHVFGNAGQGSKGESGSGGKAEFNKKGKSPASPSRDDGGAAWLSRFAWDLFSGFFYTVAVAAARGGGVESNYSKKSGKDGVGDSYYKAAYAHQESGVKGMDGVITHRGSCHCNSVQFTLLAPIALEAFDCKSKIRYPHLTSNAQTFNVVRGTRFLKIYYVTLAKTEMKSTAAHGFCSRCGVHIFRAPCHTTGEATEEFFCFVFAAASFFRTTSLQQMRVSRKAMDFYHLPCTIRALFF